MNIGFIGFGEAAYEMSCGLKKEGVKDIYAFDILNNHPDLLQVMADRAEKAGVNLVTSYEEVVKEADVIIAAVPSDKALEVSGAVKSYLKKAMLYVDVSASTPDVKKGIAEKVDDKGALFVDAAMMGPLPTYRHKVPILASGEGTDKFIEVMGPYGMNIKKVSNVPGEASGIKLIRSVYMKGLACLLLEVLEAGQQYNVENLVMNSITETMNNGPFEALLNRLVTGTAIHAERRIHEMEGVIELLEKTSIYPIMSKGTKEKLNWMANKRLKEKFGGKTPEQWQEVIAVW